MIDVQQKEEAQAFGLGSVVGGSDNIQIKKCEAEANINIQGEATAVGIIAGGVEEGSIFEECTAKGTIERGNSITGIGGICGLSFDSESFSDCSVSDFYVKGESSFDITGIGGIVGTAGVTKVPDGNTGPTVFKHCRVEETPEGGRESHIVGAGYYSDEFEQYYSTSGDVAPAYIIEISSAEELIALEREQEGYFALTSDIDLGGAEWVPVGGDNIYVAADEAPETADHGGGDEEELTYTHFFSGTFDGCNHTISNFAIHQPDNYDGAGLFGAIVSATIKDLTVKDVTVYGNNNLSAIAGIAWDSTIKNVTAENVVINAETEGICFGAIAGSGTNCNLVDCRAHANINLTDECYMAGIIAGDVQDDSSIINCTGGGIINADAYCMELGGICGMGLDIKEISGCTVDNILFNLGTGSQVAGSIAGLIGLIEVRDSGIVPTEISNFTVNNPKMITENGSYDSVDVVGDTYLSDEVREQYSGPACNITA